VKLSHCEEPHHNDSNWPKQQPSCTHNSSHKRKAGQPALAKVMCVKHKKHETPLPASKKCGTCRSNDLKYKRRKFVHRKKQQRARRRLQASSRQAVQESATVTATARPLLNLLSKMAATSTTHVARLLPIFDQLELSLRNSKGRFPKKWEYLHADWPNPFIRVNHQSTYHGGAQAQGAISLNVWSCVHMMSHLNWAIKKTFANFYCSNIQ